MDGVDDKIWMASVAETARRAGRDAENTNAIPLLR